MKYLETYKLFEAIENPNYLRNALCNWLDKIKLPDMSISCAYSERGVKGTAIALRKTYFMSNYPLFTIRIDYVKDTKQRKLSEPNKLKIDLNFGYQIEDKHHKEYVNNMRDFLVDVLKRYAYFYNKPVQYYAPGQSAFNFYINTSSISDIMKDLKEEYEIYSDAKKYNL